MQLGDGAKPKKNVSERPARIGLGGRLTVTRALGDTDLEKFGLISTPAVSEVVFAVHNKLMLGVDGCFDCASSKDPKVDTAYAHQTNDNRFLWEIYTQSIADGIPMAVIQQRLLAAMICLAPVEGDPVKEPIKDGALAAFNLVAVSSYVNQSLLKERILSVHHKAAVEHVCQEYCGLLHDNTSFINMHTTLITPWFTKARCLTVSFGVLSYVVYYLLCYAKLSKIR
jgi:hypothetical protein